MEAIGNKVILTKNNIEEQIKLEMGPNSDYMMTFDQINSVLTRCRCDITYDNRTMLRQWFQGVANEKQLVFANMFLKDIGLPV